MRVSIGRVGVVVTGVLLESLGLGDNIKDEMDRSDDVELNNGAPDCTLGFECLMHDVIRQVELHTLATHTFFE